MPTPIIVCGVSACRERIAWTEPALGEKVAYNRVRDGVGGTSVNAAVLAKELGIDASVIVTLGSDPDALVVRQGLEALGLEHHVIEAREHTSFATVEISEKNERSIRSHKGRYKYFPIAEVKDIVSSRRPDAVVATGCVAEEEPIIMAMFQALTKSGSLTVLNPRESLCKNTETMKRLLVHTDILCINHAEFQALTGKVSSTVNAYDISKLHRSGPHIVIVTLGDQGLIASDDNLYRQKNELLVLSAYSVGPEVDATGAGDSLLAAFLAFHLRGYSVKEALHLGTVAAGIAVTKLGGASVATKQELSNHYESLIRSYA